MMNRERLNALETWLQTTNTKLVHINGQRKYGGPPEVWDGPTPGAHCEVFISRIPWDAYEDLLIPLFSSVAPLWEFRLMMHFSGQNRGFAFAKYGSAAIAAEAIRQLNGYMLEPGYRLLVCLSIEKRHLCIGDLPATTSQEDLLQMLRLLAEGVESVSLKAGRGHASAVAAFSSHHAASMANKVLIEGFNKKFGMNVSVKWQPIQRQDRPQPRPQDHPQHRPQDHPQHRPQDRPQPRPQDRPQHRRQDRPQHRPQPRPQDRPQPRPHPRPQGHPQPHPQDRPQPRPQLRPQPRPQGHPQPHPQGHPQPRPHPRPQGHPQPHPQGHPQPHPQGRPQPRPQGHPQPHPQPRPQPRPQDRPQPHPQVHPQPHPQPRPQGRPQPHPHPRPQGRP